MQVSMYLIAFVFGVAAADDGRKHLVRRHVDVSPLPNLPRNSNYTQTLLRTDAASDSWIGTWAEKVHERIGVERWADWADCLASKPSPWLLLAGDSNWRGIYEAITKGFESADVKVLHAETHKSSPSQCDSRWFDRDEIRLLPGTTRELRISLRFQVRAEIRLWQMSQNLAKIYQCCQAVGLDPDWQCPGEEQDDAFDAKHWGLPQGLVFTHGLWKIPLLWKECKDYQLSPWVVKGSRFSENTPRHEFLSAFLRQWEDEIPYVRWATNFRINSHPTITNEAILQDVACQKQAAASNNIPVLDVLSLTQDSASHTVHVGDYHFDAWVGEQLIEKIFCDLGCSCS